MAVIASETLLGYGPLGRGASRLEARHAVASWVALVWGASFLYALLRYVIFGPYSAVHIPLFVLNKSIALTSLALFALALAEGGRKRRQRARAFARVAVRLVLLHVVISVALLATGSYASLRGASGWPHLRAQWMLLLGIAGVGTLLWLRCRGAHPWARSMRLLFVALGVAHVVLLGLPGWFTPGRWHAAMPPITLLAAVVGSAGLWAGARALLSIR